MKITFLALFFLVAGTAFGQAVGTISSQAQMLQVPDHPLHADEHAMAPEHSLLSSSNPYTYAQGERPLWEFGPASPPPSLETCGRSKPWKEPASASVASSARAYHRGLQRRRHRNAWRGTPTATGTNDCTGQMHKTIAPSHASDN